MNSESIFLGGYGKFLVFGKECADSVTGYSHVSIINPHFGKHRIVAAGSHKGYEILNIQIDNANENAEEYSDNFMEIIRALELSMKYRGESKCVLKITHMSESEELLNVNGLYSLFENGLVNRNRFSWILVLMGKLSYEAKTVGDIIIFEKDLSRVHPEPIKLFPN